MAPHAGSTVPLFVLALASGAAAQSVDVFKSLITSGKVAPGFTPDCAVNFTVVPMTTQLVNSNGSYAFPYFAIWDRDRVVSVYVRASSQQLQYLPGQEMGELNLVAPHYDAAPTQLPALDRYGWSRLWGMKVITAPWVDCCAETGDARSYSLNASRDGASVTLSTVQAWFPNGSHPGRDAQSSHTWTLTCDAVLGYQWVGETYLRINAAAVAGLHRSVSGGAPSVELVNFLAPKLANPWPGAASGSLTAWAVDSDGAAFNAFAENLIAGAMQRTYNITVPGVNSGGSFVAEGVGAGVWAGVLSFLGSPNATYGPTPQLVQMTCPTWMDQHQSIIFPASPNAPGGYFVLDVRFRLHFADPVMNSYIASHATVWPGTGNYPRNGTTNVVRVGTLETFDDEPVALTTPLRALVITWSQADLDIVPRAGLDGSSALAIAATSASNAAQFYTFAIPQPLLVLNASTAYNASVWIKVAPVNSSSTVMAYLRCDSYDADDFNVQYRPLQRNSVSVSAPGVWTRVQLLFTTPAWPSYADVRFVAIGDGTAFFDNFSLLRAV